LRYDTPVKRTVEEHIQRIKTAIDTLEKHCPTVTDVSEQLQTQNDLRSLRMALMHYELASQIDYRLERKAQPTISTRY
jgi:DNA-directed RNA polymerase specialized sigma subunit